MNSPADKKILKAFGEKVRSIREAKGITVRQLAANGSIDPSTISKIERGELNITLSSLYKLAEALEYDPGQMLPEL